MEIKWTERKYNVQDKADVEYKDVKMYCIKNQLPEPSFCGSHSKPHDARGLSKYHPLSFDQKLGMGICAIRCIPCACVACKSMIEKPWIYGIPPDEQ